MNPVSHAHEQLTGRNPAKTLSELIPAYLDITVDRLSAGTLKNQATRDCHSDAERGGGILFPGTLFCTLLLRDCNAVGLTSFN